MPDLRGRVVLITGGTRGIGRAIAEAVVDAGGGVAISARTEKDVEEAGAALARRGGGPVIARSCDVRDPDACRDLVDFTVAELGRLDILVNNAGLARFAPMSELTVEQWEDHIGTNLSGPFFLSRAAAPHLSATGDGWIVNIGSLASRHAFAGGTAYNASKFGLLGLTEAMMQDLRHQDVRVSIVMPGSVETTFRGRDPVGHPRDWAQRPEDVALAVLSLFEQPRHTHVSRIEMRPSRPPRK